MVIVLNSISLFSGISTFVGYLMPKPFHYSGTIYFFVEEIRDIFPQSERNRVAEVRTRLLQYPCPAR